MAILILSHFTTSGSYQLNKALAEISSKKTKTLDDIEWLMQQQCAAIIAARDLIIHA
jgi:hypothetical protein